MIASRARQEEADSMGENERRILQRDPQPHLFRPITFRSVTARNRIVLSPMCQYSAEGGMPNDWHLVHLGARAAGGAGIVFTEAVATEPCGRITHNCLGLWNDLQRDALARIAGFVNSQGAVPAIQLGHAGRKASSKRPWEGSRPLFPGDGGWQVIGPSALPFSEKHPVPLEMDRARIEQVITAFTAAARRASSAGFRLLEVHAAHGYLFHQFLSPISNHRTDEYGGSLAHRARILIECLDAIRTEWADHLPLFVRLSCSDWVEGGWTLSECIELARIMKARGNVDLIDCSSGGNHPSQQLQIHPGYQVPFAEAIRREAGIPTAAVGLIHTPDLAEEIIANGRADLVVLGRTLLWDPLWPLHAARALGTRATWPVQYERADVF
jgi:2,4-dienoyl-CoA reductase-like NADH-dependent reductase (Old Yellow Enzyme family)